MGFGTRSYFWLSTSLPSLWLGLVPLMRPGELHSPKPQDHSLCCHQSTEIGSMALVEERGAEPQWQQEPQRSGDFGTAGSIGRRSSSDEEEAWSPSDGRQVMLTLRASCTFDPPGVYMPNVSRFLSCHLLRDEDICTMLAHTRWGS